MLDNVFKNEAKKAIDNIIKLLKKSTPDTYLIISLGDEETIMSSTGNVETLARLLAIYRSKSKTVDEVVDLSSMLMHTIDADMVKKFAGENSDEIIYNPKGID